MTVTDAPVFATTQLGEISDEEDLTADLDSLPEVPEGGNLYEETPVYEEAVVVEEEPAQDSSNEDVW
jgi:hypothetical protein